MLGDKVPERFRPALRQASLAFPAFNNLAVRGRRAQPAVGRARARRRRLHRQPRHHAAARPRQVQNIIVFVNSSSDYRNNEQLQSYFMPLEIRDGNGDKTMNPVFEPRQIPAGAAPDSTRRRRRAAARSSARRTGR